MAPGSTPDSTNDACERVARSMYQELGLKRWKDFSLVAPNDLTAIAEISAEEAVHVSELVAFSREANWGSLQYKFEQVQQSMEIALKNYADLLRNLSMFQNFVTVGVPLDASLNELSNLKAKLFDQRDLFVKELSGNRSAGESIEEDSATHSARPKSLGIAPGAPWKVESTLETTSFRQQVRSLQLNASANRLFRNSFVDPNLAFISFIGEKKQSGEDNETESVVVTFEKKKNNPQGDSSLMLMQTATGDEVMRLSAVGKAKDMLDILYKTPVMADFEISRIKDPSGEFKKSLLALETKLAITNFKVGVLYVRPGQTKEDELFTNSKGSRAYEEFLKLLGDRVTLKGWKGSAAGLDTRDNRNGTHSIFASHDNFSIMYHVATMMPYEDDNEEQKLERKRHIGNDVTCVVFCDEGATFNPSSIRTEFIHVYLIVTQYTFNNRPYYRLEVAVKDGVAKFGPSVPNCLFPTSKSFHQFIFTKLINADIAASSAPAFRKRIMRTRSALLSDIVADAKLHKWTKKGGSGGARDVPPLEREVSNKSIRPSIGSGTRSVRAKGAVSLEEDEVRIEKRPALVVPTTSSSHGIKDKSKEKDKEREKSPRG